MASNHASNLDPIALAAVCPRKLNFMAKEELFRNAFFSGFFYSIKAFPVKRGSVDLSALKEAMRRLKLGEPLLLFPEGSRRFDSRAATPYPGVGFLAAKIDIPVVPVFIRGTESVLPKGAKFLRFGRIRVSFGRQISVNRKLSYKDISRQVMGDISRMQEVA